MDRLGNILKQRLAAQQTSGSDHPAPDLLAAFAGRELRAAEHERVLAHLGLCPACRQTIALATLEPAELQKPVSEVGSRATGKFPLAMRWASLVAALAVAVGVGAIFYEHHEKESLPSARATEKVQLAEQSSPVANAAPQSAQPEVRHAAPKTPSNTNQRGTVARFKRDAAGDLESKKTETNSVVGGLMARGRAKYEQSPAQTVDAFVASNAVNIPNRADVAPLESKPGVAVSAPPPQVLSGVTAQAPAPLPMQPNAVTETAELRRTEVGTKSGTNGGAVLPSQSGFAAPRTMKQVATPTIGGSVGSRAAFASSLAHWTISANGKLQRLSQNGGSTAVEPAPGVTVRAVAAHGIEVWAGGSQPDLSAPQWRERPVLFHSSDAGESWTKIEGPWQGSIQSLALVDLHSLTLVSSDGKWTTTDAGKSWARK